MRISDWSSDVCSSDLCPDHLYFFTGFVLRENDLFKLIAVVGNDAVGRIHDILRGAIILLQFEYLQVRVIFFKIQDVLDIRSPERINTLGIVTYHTDILMDSREPFYDQILGKIRVLVLVNHDVPKLLLVLVQSFEVRSEEH